jgi:hypothetical protein
MLFFLFSSSQEDDNTMLVKKLQLFEKEKESFKVQLEKLTRLKVIASKPI